MTIASDLFRTVTVKINDIGQQLPYIVVNQADDNGKIIRFVPMDHGQKVTGFTGARLYYPPRSDHEYGDYVTGVEADGAWDFTIPVGVLSAGRVECNLLLSTGMAKRIPVMSCFWSNPQCQVFSTLRTVSRPVSTRSSAPCRIRLIRLSEASTRPLATRWRTLVRPRHPLMRV